MTTPNSERTSDQKEESLHPVTAPAMNVGSRLKPGKVEDDEFLRHAVKSEQLLPQFQSQMSFSHIVLSSENQRCQFHSVTRRDETKQVNLELRRQSNSMTKTENFQSQFPNATCQGKYLQLQHASSLSRPLANIEAHQQPEPPFVALAKW